VKLVLDFVTEDEEAELLEKLDQVPWDTSQSGRLKQVYHYFLNIQPMIEWKDKNWEPVRSISR
jgi:hypothetical protein